MESTENARSRKPGSPDLPAGQVLLTNLFLPFGLGLLLEANDQASRRGERPSVECLCIRQEPSVSAASISTSGNTLPLMDTSILVARGAMLKGQQLARLATCG